MKMNISFKSIAVLGATILLGVSLSTEASLEIPNTPEQSTGIRIVEHTTCAGFEANVIAEIDHDEKLRQTFFKELSDGLIESFNGKIYTSMK